MSEVKILMVDLHCPLRTDYVDLYLIPLHTWGKDMTEVEFMLVSDKYVKHVATSNIEVFRLQEELAREISTFKKEIGCD
jgi:aryl-alcohol dehydrogenase-like predicted oxidoreductase